MSAADASVFDEAWAEAQASLQENYAAELEADKAEMSAETAVFDDVKTRAMNAGVVPDQAAQYAKLYSTFFRVMGTRAGVDPMALYESYGFDIKRALPGEAQYSAKDGLDLSLEVIRAGRIPALRKKVEKAKGPSVLEAIRSKGGVYDDGGDLAALDLPKRFMRARQADSGPDMLGGGAVVVDAGGGAGHGFGGTHRAADDTACRYRKVYSVGILYGWGH